jgi:hypothetical protein
MFFSFAMPQWRLRGLLALLLTSQKAWAGARGGTLLCRLLRLPLSRLLPCMSQPSSCCAVSWRNQGQAVQQKSQTQGAGCCDKKVAYHGVAPVCLRGC